MVLSLRTSVRLCLVLLLAAISLFGCATEPGKPAAADLATPYVIMGADGNAVARLLTTAASCPMITLDGQTSRMDVRALPATLPQRPTQSLPTLSKASAFPVLTCEKQLASSLKSASIDGRALPLPKADANRIVVIGDTGCRLKASDNAFQSCNDIKQYPFATIAAVAADWKPDLVIHVGDLHYRENPCPEGNAGCANSPWGYGLDAWQADFFSPGKRLLQVAPWVMVRGNHESCLRAGQGWWRFIDPRPLQPKRDCNNAADDDIGNYSDPYAVPLGSGAQLIVLDTANTTGAPIPESDGRFRQYLEMAQKADALSQKAAYNIGLNHHPILGFSSKQNADGKIALVPGNPGLQSVLGTAYPLMLPPRINVMLSGHIHLWQQVSFGSAHATQFIAGISGTAEDKVPLPALLPKGAMPAPGAIADQLSSWVDGFGFMTMERSGAEQWDVKVWDTAGQQMNACRVVGSKSLCEKAQVQ